MHTIFFSNNTKNSDLDYYKTIIYKNTFVYFVMYLEKKELRRYVVDII